MFASLVFNLAWLWVRDLAMKFGLGLLVEPPLTLATRLCFLIVHRSDFRPSYLVTHIVVLQSDCMVLIMDMPSVILYA